MDIVEEVRNSDASRRSFAFTATALSLFLLVSVLAQIPDGRSPERLQRSARAYHVFWPHGWEFFSNVAERDVIVLYRAPVSPEPQVLTHQLLDRRSLGGVSRASYAQFVEAQEIFLDIPDQFWRTCGRMTVAECGADGLAVYHGTNRARAQTYCGSMLIAVERAAVQRSERESQPTIRQVRQVARLELACTW